MIVYTDKPETINHPKTKKTENTLKTSYRNFDFQIRIHRINKMVADNILNRGNFSAIKKKYAYTAHFY